jgi:hypothetical protein
MHITDFTKSGPLTFSDLPEAEAVKLAQGMGTHSKRSFEEPLTYAGYNDVEVHYILCTKDKIIAPEHQEAMVAIVEQSSGRKVKVHRIESDHVPNVSHAEELLGILKEIVV